MIPDLGEEGGGGRKRAASAVPEMFGTEPVTLSQLEPISIVSGKMWLSSPFAPSRHLKSFFKKCCRLIGFSEKNQVKSPHPAPL